MKTLLQKQMTKTLHSCRNQTHLPKLKFTLAKIEIHTCMKNQTKLQSTVLLPDNDTKLLVIFTVIK